MGGISDADLDAILQFDSPPLTLTVPNSGGVHGPAEPNNSSIMHFNRERMPSQMSTVDVNVPAVETQPFDLSVDTTQMRQLPSSPSLIINTQDIEGIALIDADRTMVEGNEGHTNLSISMPSAPLKSSKDIKEEIDFSLYQNSGQPGIESSFEREFARFQEDDFELPSLFFEMEEPTVRLPRITLVNSDGVVLPRRLQTLAAERGDESAQINSITCPPPAIRSSSSPRSSTPAGGQCSATEDDPMNFLTLIFSTTPSSSTSSAQECISSKDLGTSTQAKPVAVARDKPQPTSRSAAAPRFVAFAPDATTIPPSIQQLYDVIKTQYSDFAFVYALSAQLCQERVPMDCFTELKMGLLLSLASIGMNPDRPPIPIIAIGNDTFMANYLMLSIGDLAQRFVGPVDDAKAPSSAGYRDHKWIEANPVLLAKGGVYFVGDWSHVKVAQAEKLFKDIECSRITVDNTTNMYPLQTAIWTHWRTFKNNASDQQIFNKFVKIFGIPIYMSDSNHEALVKFILEQSSERIFESTVDHLSISAEDMRNFLALVANRTVDLTAAASDLLQKYFVAMRSARPDCLTQQAFAVLKRFAESFAKLSLRSEVLPVDALAAVFMCEHFIQNVYGANDNPPPLFQSHNFVGLIDDQMAQFEAWLQAFVEKYYDHQQ